MVRSSPARRLRGFGTSVFAEMSGLAARTGAINLGQGFPDTQGPEEMARTAARAVLEGRGNQYPPGNGFSDLRAAVAEHQSRFYGLEFDPESEVLITTGRPRASRPLSWHSWSQGMRCSSWSPTTTPTPRVSPWPARSA